MEFHRPAVFNGEAFWLSFSAVIATASEPTVSFSRVSLVAQIRNTLIWLTCRRNDNKGLISALLFVF